MFLVLVFIAKSGLSGSQNMLYLSFGELFPTLFATTAYGFCNILARAFTAIAPTLSRMQQPLPMIAFTFSSFILFLMVFGLIVTGKDADDISCTTKDDSYKNIVVKDSQKEDSKVKTNEN